MLKQSLLQVLIQEPVQLVRHSTGQIVSAIAKFEVPAGQWPELLQFLNEYVRSKEPAQREVSCTEFCILIKIIDEAFASFLQVKMYIFIKMTL